MAFLGMSGLKGKLDINGVTWYLSAMILAMLILFPLLSGTGDLFGHHSTIGHGYDVGVSMSHVQYSPFTKRMGRVLL